MGASVCTPRLWAPLAQAYEVGLRLTLRERRRLPPARAKRRFQLGVTCIIRGQLGSSKTTEVEGAPGLERAAAMGSSGEEVDNIRRGDVELQHDHEGARSARFRHR